MKYQRINIGPVLNDVRIWKVITLSNNVITWKLIKLGKHQHGQFIKLQLGTRTLTTWAGGTREAIRILEFLNLARGDLQKCPTFLV